METGSYGIMGMKRKDARIHEVVGAAIAKQRGVVGVSQETLAAAVGLSRSSIANVARGRQKISISLLYQIAEVLQTMPHELIPAPEGKAGSKGKDVPIPQNLPAGDRDWIRGVLSPGKRRG